LDLASELCQTVADEFRFFTLHSFLEVGKTQDLSSKFWQTLEDALIGRVEVNPLKMLVVGIQNTHNPLG
jgi:hypothetical protein